MVVRAIDNAGNIQQAILPPTNGDLSLPESLSASGNAGTIGAWSVIAALLGVLMGGILLFIRRRRNEEVAEETHDTAAGETTERVD